MQRMGIDSNVAVQEKKQLFLQKLRSATEPEHAALEACTLSVNLLKKDVTTEEYVLYLAHMQQVVAWHEKNTFPVLSSFFTDIDSRRKAPLIVQDLKKLGQSTELPVVAPYSIKEGATMPVWRAMGYLYVIEGSTLGGRMILKHVNNVLGVDEQNGAAFFNGYGSATGKHWKEFLEIFATYAIIENKEEEIIEAAKDAFRSIGNYFGLNSAP